MNVLLLGNGFDLYHYLPTKYINFMHTMKFLIEADDLIIYKTVGHVFGSSKLRAMDSFISDCYENNRRAFDVVKIDQETLISMVNNAKQNSWYLFFCNRCTEDIGWVDFEKEIEYVVNIFDKLTEDYKKDHILENSMLADEENTLLFFKDIVSKVTGIGGGVAFTNESTYEAVPGTTVRYIEREKVARLLLRSLNEFIDIFTKYLVAFIENPIAKKQDMIIKSTMNMFVTTNVVASYNYTHTYEYLYDASQFVTHIHGELPNRVVLGINSDYRDIMGSVDTTFVAFKKYFQRVKMNIDQDYIRAIDYLRTGNKDSDKTLIIVGHSIDTSDADTLKEFIETASRVLVYYHCDSALGTYIANLIRLFGKNQFDEMRRFDKLHFMKLPQLGIWNNIPYSIREESSLHNNGENL